MVTRFKFAGFCGFVYVTIGVSILAFNPGFMMAFIIGSVCMMGVVTR